MTKIIWGLIGLNTIGLFIFIGAYFVLNEGKNVDYQEKGWTIILAGVGLCIILLAAAPLYFSQSNFTRMFSGFFAALPLVVAIGILLSNSPALRKGTHSYANTYYTDKAQHHIAVAIEEGDTARLKEAIAGQDLTMKSKRVWEEEGLNYLQFAIRVRSNPISFPFDDEKNKAVIKMLISKGVATTPALAEATQYLPLEILTFLFDAGADPNCRGFVFPGPLLFELITNDEDTIDKAILLLQRGADVNAKNDNNLSPVMYAAHNARLGWKNTWRLVFYMLERENADYNYTTKDGNNLANIIWQTRVDAETKKETTPEYFNKVVDWLEYRQLNTTL